MNGNDQTLSILVDDVGDWQAPEGSVPWCIALRNSMQSVVKSVATVPNKMRNYVERAIKNRAWVNWPDADGKPFRTFEAFCAAKQPYGLDRPYRELLPFIEAVKGPVATAALTAAVAPTLSEAGKQGGRGNKKAVGDIQGLSPHPGTTSDYLAARIARDAPEVHERMKLGEFPSVRAAALAAGLVKPSDPVKVALRALRAVPEERRRELVTADESIRAWLTAELARP